MNNEGARAVADASIARLLDEIGSPRPASIGFQDEANGEVTVRIAFDDDAGEIVCRLSSGGDLLAASLIDF